MIAGFLLACLAPAATPPVQEERTMAAVPKVVEPAWVSTFVVGPTSGPPDTPCEGKLETESPLLTADDLALWFHCTRRAIYDRVFRGQVPGVVRLG
ncbi:MAG TPA: hypothetical protein PKY30_18250, partial [Myxococcota bacterium]|nr:hypothetical protein [Myxococcota bacterium]